MRLLHAETWQLEEFMSEEEIPSYAILSHTWGKAADEVKLQDLTDPNFKTKVGYQKIEYCCAQALKDGYQWIWVDTCCIDKTSTAELSEAINSMFRWYQNSGVCYVYLADCELENESANGRDIEFWFDENSYSKFSDSRWFTRGWTLQELIAPRTVIFYSSSWNRLGTKKQLARSLSRATRIDKEILEHPELDFTLWSDAVIMSWASERKTTRIEDIAYCLLGLFNINMPLLYGEGKKAFFRLQEEIMKRRDDHSLFAWGIESATSIQQMQLDKEWSQRVEEAMNEEDYGHSTAEISLKLAWYGPGLLAESPADFRHSGKLISWRVSSLWTGAYSAPTSIVQRGVRIEVPVFSMARRSRSSEVSGPKLSISARDERRFVFIALQCTMENRDGTVLGIPLLPTSFGTFIRYGPLVLIDGWLLDKSDIVAAKSDGYQGIVMLLHVEAR